MKAAAHSSSGGGSGSGSGRANEAVDQDGLLARRLHEEYLREEEVRSFVLGRSAGQVATCQQLRGEETSKASHIRSSLRLPNQA